jgi:antitoxin (DNA-binding transcriptional repressor) of toxin-antitoxin stability system
VGGGALGISDQRKLVGTRIVVAFSFCRGQSSGTGDEPCTENSAGTLCRRPNGEVEGGVSRPGDADEQGGGLTSSTARFIPTRATFLQVLIVRANVEISIVKHYASQMKTASVRELRQNFGGLLAWLEEGQEIQITMRRRVVARLVPDGRNIVAKVRMPDFAARLKKLHGKKVIGAQEAQAVLDENKGEF